MATLQVLDQLLEGQNPDNFMDEEDPDGQDEAEADVQNHDAGGSGFVNYIQHKQVESNASPNPNPNPDPESGSALL